MLASLAAHTTICTAIGVKCYALEWGRGRFQGNAMQCTAKSVKFKLCRLQCGGEIETGEVGFIATRMQKAELCTASAGGKVDEL